MSMGYDPEVPAGYQDADIEMAEAELAATELGGDAPVEPYGPWGLRYLVESTYEVVDDGGEAYYVGCRADCLVWILDRLLEVIHGQEHMARQPEGGYR